MLITKRLGGPSISTVTVNQLPNQTAICTNDITITVAVIGDMTNHTILWEQIAGDTNGVTYISDLTSLTLHYINITPPGTHDDKQFRITIDKGTSLEQSKTVWIYGAATDYWYPQNYIATNNASSYSEIGPLIINAKISNGQIYDHILLQLLYGYFIEWDPLITATTLIFQSYEIQQYNVTTGVWNTIATQYSESQIWYYNPLENTIYRIKATLLNSSTNQPWIIYSNVVSYYHFTDATPVFQLGDVMYPVLDYHINTVSNFQTFIDTVFTAPNDSVLFFNTQSTNSGNVISSYLTYINTVFTAPNDSVLFFNTQSTNSGNVISSYVSFTGVTIG